MPGLTEKLRLLVEGPVGSQQVIRRFDDIGQAADRASTRADGGMERVGARMTRVGAAMTGFGVLALVGLGKATRATSDLNEATSLTGDIFGDLAAEAGGFAETATSIGMSERAAREMQAQLGGLLQAMELSNRESLDWSNTLLDLGADLGSAFNRDPEQAVMALGGALRGEFEAVRQFNVVLDMAAVRAHAVEMGLAASTGEVGRNAQAMATLDLIMQQTSAVQGNYARTATDRANAERTAAAEAENAAAALGQSLNPIMTDLANAAADLLGWFNDLPEPMQQLIVKGALLGATVLTLGGGLLTLAGHVMQNVEAFRASGRSLGKYAGAVGIAAAAVTAGVMVYRAWTEGSRRVEAQTEALTEAILEQGNVVEAVTSVVANYAGENAQVADVLARAGVTAAEVAEAVDAGGDTWDAYVDSILAGADAAGVSKTEQIVLRNALDELATAVGNAEERVADLEQIERDNIDTSDVLEKTWMGVADAWAGGADAANEQADATEDLEDAVSDANTEAQDFTSTIDELTSALGELLGETTSVMEAESEWESQLDDLKAAVDEAGLSLDITTDAGRENLDNAVALRDTLPDLAQAYLDEGASLGEAEGKLRDHIAALRDDLIQVGLNEDEVDDYLTTIGLTPTAVSTAFQAIGLTEAEQLFLDIKKAIDDIPRSVTVQLNTIGELGALAPQSLRAPIIPRSTPSPPSTPGGIRRSIGGGGAASVSAPAFGGGGAASVGVSSSGDVFHVSVGQVVTDDPLKFAEGLSKLARSSGNADLAELIAG